jgi:DNA-binding CsgD family transcriptional regulator
MLSMSTGTQQSPTRQRVAQMTGAGLSPREIALALNISTQAVYKHLKALGMRPAVKP